MNNFDLNRIREQLASIRVVFHQSLESTNTTAVELSARESLPLLVLCDQQTAGRGQPGRTWISGEGSLTFSLAINVEADDKHDQQRRLLPLTAAVAVCETIERFCFDETAQVTPQIKWPNDVLIGGRKVCGILVEATSTVAVIGIGINLFNEPEQLQQNVEAVSAGADKRSGTFPAGVIWPQRNEESAIADNFLIHLVQRLVHWQDLGNQTGTNAVTDACRQRLWSRQTALTIQLPDGQTISGTEADIGQGGELTMLVKGKRRSFVSACLLPGP